MVRVCMGTREEYAGNRLIVIDDFREEGLTDEEAQDRTAWRLLVRNNDSTHITSGTRCG